MTLVILIKIVYVPHAHTVPQKIPHSIGLFTSINPVIVHINSLWQEVDCGLKILHAHTTRNPTSVPCLVPETEQKQHN